MYKGIMGLQKGGPTKWRDTAPLADMGLEELEKLKRSMPRNLYTPIGTGSRAIENPLGGPFRKALLSAIEARQDENIMELLQPRIESILKEAHERHQDLLTGQLPDETTWRYGETVPKRVPFDLSSVPEGEVDVALRKAIEDFTGEAVRDKNLMDEFRRIRNLPDPAPTVNLRGGIRSLTQEGGTSVTGGRNLSRPSGVSRWKGGSPAFGEAVTAMHRDRVKDASESASQLWRKEMDYKYGPKGVGSGPGWTDVPGRLREFARKKWASLGLKSLGYLVPGLGVMADQALAVTPLGSGDLPIDDSDSLPVIPPMGPSSSSAEANSLIDEMLRSIEAGSPIR